VKREKTFLTKCEKTGNDPPIKIFRDFSDKNNMRLEANFWVFGEFIAPVYFS